MSAHSILHGASLHGASATLLGAAASVVSLACSLSCSRTPTPSSEPVSRRSVAERPPASTPAEARPQDAPEANTVTVVGTLVRRGPDEVEVCPAGQIAACPGFSVVGDLPPGAISNQEVRSVWRLRGKLVGGELFVAQAEREKQALQDTDFSSPCRDQNGLRREASQASSGQQQEARANPEPEQVEAIREFESNHRDSFAGDWWDAQGRTFVVSVTKGRDSAERELRESLPNTAVCVVDAKHDLVQLDQARARAGRRLTELGVDIMHVTLDVVGNRYLYFVESIPFEAWQQLEEELGGPIKIVPFIAVHGDGHLASLPNKGTVDLVTQATRSNVQMEALGVFEVHYDPHRRCVYLKNARGERVLPVWPLGYWATHEPLEIHDFDDRLVAAGGASTEFVGGQVATTNYQAENLCGAHSVWVGAPAESPHPGARRNGSSLAAPPPPAASVPPAPDPG